MAHEFFLAGLKSLADGLVAQADEEAEAGLGHDLWALLRRYEDQDQGRHTGGRGGEGGGEGGGGGAPGSAAAAAERGHRTSEGGSRHAGSFVEMGHAKGHANPIVADGSVV